MWVAYHSTFFFLIWGQPYFKTTYNQKMFTSHLTNQRSFTKCHQSLSVIIPETCSSSMSVGKQAPHSLYTVCSWNQPWHRL